MLWNGWCYPVAVTSQRAIILLSGCLGICLFALGFLLGRESNREPATLVSALAPQVVTGDPAPASPAAARSEAPSEAPAPTLPPPVSPKLAPPVSPTVAPRTGAASAPIRFTSGASASPGPADSAADKQAVARYFDQVDRLQNVDVDNPEASASALIGAATSGDTSGLQQLVAQARDTEQKVRAITPPPPCAQYHQQLLSMLGESHSMLQRLEQGIGGGGLDSLPALVSQANAAKSRSEKLADQARELKRRYGVAH